MDNLEDKIKEILLDNTTRVKLHGGLVTEVEDWLWSGDFDKVAEQLAEFINSIKDSAPSCNCDKCTGSFNTDNYYKDGI